MRIILLILILLPLQAFADDQELIKKLRDKFPCDGLSVKFCMDDDNEYGDSEIFNLKNGYKLINIYDKTNSGTMSLYETFLQDVNNNFYHIGQTTGTCVDTKNLLVFERGHCNAAEASFSVSKIDLNKKKLIKLKSMACTDGDVLDKYMHNNFLQSKCNHE